jgi:hypothetical protein
VDWQVLGTHGTEAPPPTEASFDPTLPVPQMLYPPAPQVCPEGHEPQSRMPPHPSLFIPQLYPRSVHVFAVHPFASGSVRRLWPELDEASDDGMTDEASAPPPEAPNLLVAALPQEITAAPRATARANRPIH